MKCWTGWRRGHGKVHRGLRRRTPAEMRQTPAKGAGNSCPRKLSAWRRCSRQRSLRGSLWEGQQTLPICRAISTVGCTGRMCLCSHMDIMKCCGIYGAVVILLLISACVYKHLGGACWISTESHWVRMRWSVRGRRSEQVLLKYVIVSIRLQRTWLLTKLVSLTLSCQFWRKCPAW